MLLSVCRAVLMVESGHHTEAERTLHTILEGCKPSNTGNISSTHWQLPLEYLNASVGPNSACSACKCPASKFTFLA